MMHIPCVFLVFTVSEIQLNLPTTATSGKEECDRYREMAAIVGSTVCCKLKRNFENEPQNQSKISNCSLLQKLSTKIYPLCCSKQENLELGEKRKQQELLQQVCIILPRNLCFY